MPDAQFADPRLAPLSDTFEGARSDLAPYLRLLREFGVRSLLDLGCGTGTLALLASAMGVEVTGVDPAYASLEVARAKAGAETVTWHHGTVATAPAGPYDAVVMTGNVAQVFVTDEEWLAVLAECRRRLAPQGRLVFETRRPEARAWEAWAEPFEASSTFGNVGLVHQSRQLLEVAPPLVTFRWTYRFPDGTAIESDSTLRWRSDDENRALLQRARFCVDDVREAPDRPGLERVYVASLG